MTTIIRQLLDFARASTPRKTPVDLRQVLAQTIDMLRSIAEKNHVELGAVPGGGPAMAEIDAGQIQQALANLTINAIQSMPGGGKVDFAVSRRTARPPRRRRRPRRRPITPSKSATTASASPRSTCSHFFEPFFTTKAARRRHRAGPLDRLRASSRSTAAGSRWPAGPAKEAVLPSFA